MSVISERAYEKLRTMIYRRQLQPGDRLVERDLAAQFGISRIPLRESLARLESEGLVRSIPNSATYVEAFSPTDILEIYSLRLMLEPTATRLATIRAGSKLVKPLQRLCDQMTAQQAKKNFVKLDEFDYRFHLAIVRASGHKRLIRAYETCHIQIMASHKEDEMRERMPPDSTAAEHALIIENIAANRPAAAERAAHEHVRNVMRLKEDLMGVRFDDLPTS